MDNGEFERELWEAINWRKMPHNHDNALAVLDTCPLCVIEQALYGGKE